MPPTEFVEAPAYTMAAVEGSTPIVFIAVEESPIPFGSSFLLRGFTPAQARALAQELIESAHDAERYADEKASR